MTKPRFSKELVAKEICHRIEVRHKAHGLTYLHGTSQIQASLATDIGELTRNLPEDLVDVLHRTLNAVEHQAAAFAQESELRGLMREFELPFLWSNDADVGKGR